METLQILIHGYKGKMGRVIEQLIIEEKNLSICAGIDFFAEEGERDYPVFKTIDACNIKADAIIDFSTAAAVPALLDYAESHKTPVVLCTTGLNEEMNAKALKVSESVAVFKSANMSLGINLISNLLKKISPVLKNAGFDIEIVEKHHNQKIDAPSGTALLLADSINESLNNEMNYVYDRSQIREKRTGNEIGLHAVRGGTIVGVHEVIFAGNNEIIELNHSAQSKEVFGVGAVNAAKFIAGKAPGMYDMQEMLNDLIQS